MIVVVYQQCKYNIKNMKNWLCIFVFLTLVFILNLKQLQKNYFP